MEGKIVLISGGTSGLGLATTKLFLAKSATVIVASRSREKFEKVLDASNKNLEFISTDFNDMESVKNLYKVIQTNYSTLDIAVNNVGNAVMKPITAYSEKDFDYQMNVNLKSLWLSLKNQIPLMVKEENKSKHIINVSSVNGLGGAEYASLYSAAKAGVISLTKSAALELAQSNISINVVVPGPFDTPMLDCALLAQAGGNTETKKQVEEQYKQFIPKGRFGNPDEFAETVVWLCEGNNKYMSGHSIILDGGLSSRFR